MAGGQIGKLNGDQDHEPNTPQSGVGVVSDDSLDSGVLDTLKEEDIYSTQKQRPRNIL